MALTGPGGAGSGEFYSRTIDGDTYVIPVEAMEPLAQERVDLELFNVTGLIEQGYDDRSRETLPVIVRDGSPGKLRSAGLSVERELESLNGAAVEVDKGARSSTSPLDALLASGPETSVWLDAKVLPTVLPTAPVGAWRW